MTGSKTKVQNSKTKRGGMITMTRGNWPGRIIDSGTEKLGRWTYITLTGKNNRKLTIYTLYRVCDQKHGSGDCTIYLQQQNDLIQANRIKTEPRESILEDLSAKNQQNQKQGHDIIVIGDANEDVYNGKRIKEFLTENNLYNVIQRLHEKEGPATYDRGSKCIDIVAASNSIAPESIVHCGYMPFYEGIFTDHRGVYVDIKAEDIFHRATPVTNREIYERFTPHKLQNVKNI